MVGNMDVDFADTLCSQNGELLRDRGAGGAGGALAPPIILKR